MESIDNPCHIVVAVNPKEYYEHFENFDCNKKQKGQKTGTAGMNFGNFAAGIADSNQIDNFDAPINECIEQQRFTVIGGEMQKSTVMGTKLSQTNDKRYYYLNRITSLPVSHPYLNDLTTYKEKKGENIEKYFIQEKNNLKKLERDAFSKNSSLDIYNQILSQNFKYYDLKTNEKIKTSNLKTNWL